MHSQTCSSQPLNNSIPYSVYPGKTYQISVVAIVQRKETVPSIVRSTVTTTKSDFHSVDYQYLQQTKNTCTNLNYTVFSLSQKVNLQLYTEGNPCSKYDGGPLYSSVTINQTCPPGFNISESARSCVCEPRLAHIYKSMQYITNGLGQITRESNQHFWIGCMIIHHTN